MHPDRPLNLTSERPVIIVMLFYHGDNLLNLICNGSAAVKNHTFGALLVRSALQRRKKKIPLLSEVIAEAKADEVIPVMIEIKEINNCHHFLLREEFVLFLQENVPQRAL